MVGGREEGWWEGGRRDGGREGGGMVDEGLRKEEEGRKGVGGGQGRHV